MDINVSALYLLQSPKDSSYYFYTRSFFLVFLVRAPCLTDTAAIAHNSGAVVTLLYSTDAWRQHQADREDPVVTRAAGVKHASITRKKPGEVKKTRLASPSQIPSPPNRTNEVNSVCFSSAATPELIRTCPLVLRRPSVWENNCGHMPLPSFPLRLGHASLC